MQKQEGKEKLVEYANNRFYQLASSALGRFASVIAIIQYYWLSLSLSLSKTTTVAAIIDGGFCVGSYSKVRRQCVLYLQMDDGEGGWLITVRSHFCPCIKWYSIRHTAFIVIDRCHIVRKSIESKQNESTRKESIDSQGE